MPITPTATPTAAQPHPSPAAGTSVVGGVTAVVMRVLVVWLVEFSVLRWLGGMAVARSDGVVGEC